MKIEELKKEIETKEKELINLKEQMKKINNYETIIILDVKTNIKEFDLIKKELEEIFQNIIEFDELGTKILAYEIKKNKEGYYLEYTWQGMSNDVAEFETYARKEDKILKFLTMRTNEEY